MRAGERILIFGDYDVDGVLSVVMLHKALTSLGAGVDYFIPERLKDGYGIKDHHVSVPQERGTKLVISVDCGIKAVGFVAAAREKGIDVIVTDHHRPGDSLPERRRGPESRRSAAPDIRTRAWPAWVSSSSSSRPSWGKRARTPSVPHYMKLVCIGTVADVAELKGENRLFVKHGLEEPGERFQHRPEESDRRLRFEP